MSFITNLFSGGASSLIDSVGKVLDNVVTTRDEKLQHEFEMRKAELLFQSEMAKLAVEEKRMALQDIDSARKMGSAIQTSEHATSLSKNIISYLALGTTTITLILFFVLIFRPGDIPPDSKDIILYILGVLSTVIVQIYSYYFGSSAGSAEKSKQLQDLNNNPLLLKN